VHLRRTDSTNDRARELAMAGAPHGTLVTAAEQTAGRGRQGRRWSAPPGSSLLMSLVLRRPPPLLPLTAAVAVCDVAGEDARVKWPNDVVVERDAEERDASGRTTAEHGVSSVGATPLAKLAGILVEGRSQEGWAVMGVGLNVAVRLEDLPPELRTSAATLGEGPDAIEPILARLLKALERRLAEPAQAIVKAWGERDALRGRGIAWAQGRGRATGIDAEGRLVVELPDGGRTTLAAGEVHLEPQPAR